MKSWLLGVHAVLSVGMLVLLLGPLWSAEPESTPAQRAKAEELVRQLGDDSFDVRRQASEQLLQLGAVAEEALRKGTSSTDTEVRRRCQSLLTLLSASQRKARLDAFVANADGKEKPNLAGWARFSKLAGDDADARKLFVEVFRADADLLESAEREPTTATPSLADRSARLRFRLVTPGGDKTALVEVASLLTLASDSRLKVDAATMARLLEGLETFGERAALVKQLQDNAPARKLFLTFLKERSSVDLERALTVALGLGLPESVAWASKVATDDKAPGGARGLAVMLVGKLGDKTDVPRLQPLLDNTTSVGTRMLGGTLLKAELRDVALAATIQLSGQKPADFGFPYPQAVPGLKVIPAPGCLGFANDVDRKAAFKKWQDRAAKP